MIRRSPQFSVIPALSRYPASPSLWAERSPFVAQTRAGWMPGQARHDGRGVSRVPRASSLPHRHPRRRFPQSSKQYAKTEKGRLSDPSMSLVLFTDPGLFLNVPKAEEVYNEGCPVENTPFPLPAPETEISLDIGSPPSDTLNITRR